MLTTSEYAVLGLLTFGEKSGYDLWCFAERSVGFIWAPAKSQIYKVLPRLERSGLVRSRLVGETRRFDKQLHRLTPAGRAALRRWLTTLDADADPDVQLLKIFFGRHAPPSALAAHVAAYREHSVRTLALYDALDRRLPRDDRNDLPLAVLALGLRRTREAVEWADELLARLDAEP